MDTLKLCQLFIKAVQDLMKILLWWVNKLENTEYQNIKYQNTRIPEYRIPEYLVVVSDTNNIIILFYINVL